MTKRRDRILKFFAVTFVLFIIANVFSNTAQIVFFVLSIVSLILSIRQLVTTWRCPRCDKFLGKISLKEVPLHCKDCGKKLY